MATANTTSSTRNQAARIAGALKGLAALRNMERAAENEDAAETAAEFYAKRQANVQAMVAALGPMTPEQEGTIAVLVEFIALEFAGSTANLTPGGWTPLSAMTTGERQMMINEADAAHEADEAAFCRSRKVISLSERRALQ